MYTRDYNAELRRTETIQLASRDEHKFLGGEEAAETWWLGLDDGKGGIVDVIYEHDSGEDQPTSAEQLEKTKKQWAAYSRAISTQSGRDFSPPRAVRDARERLGLAPIALSRIDAAVEASAREVGGNLDLKKKFQRYDKKRMGVVTRKQFQSVLREARIVIPASEKRTLAAALEIDADNVDYQMFCDLAKKGMSAMRRMLWGSHGE